MLGALLLLCGHARIPPQSLVRAPQLAPVALKDGDLVFRRGRSFASDVVLSADPKSMYSHVGIVVVREAVPMVVHAEPGDGRERGGVTMADQFSTFIEPDETSAYAVYRVRPGLEAIARRAAQRAESYERAATPFDSAFDLSTPDRLYCTELVWRSYLDAGLNLAPAGPEELGLPFFKKQVLLPSLISGSKDLVEVAKFRSGNGGNR